MNTAGSTFKWEGYAEVATDGYSVPRDGLQEESVTLQINGPMYFSSTE